MNLSWSESNTNGVGGFNILQSTNGGVSFAPVDAVGGGATSDTLHGLSGAMDTSQFEVKATAGSSIATSSPQTPVAGTHDTDGDGTNDNVDGWAGFTDKTQEAKLAPPRVPNPTYVAVTISTIPTNYVVDYVNAQGQAVVHDPTQTLTATNSYSSIYGPSGTYTYQPYCFWDKGATNPVILPPIQAGQANSNGIYTRNITGLSDAGTVIGVDCFPYGGGMIDGFSGREQAWRWTSGMTQMQYLADVDVGLGAGNGASVGYFATIPYFAKTFNGTEEIIACHEQSDPSASANNRIKSYIERWTTPAGSSTSSPQVYPYTGFTSANDDVNFIFDTPNAQGGTLDASSHESRLATADNGSGTTIGFGAHLERYDYYDGNGTLTLSLDINGQITTGNPGTLTLDPVGGGLIVNGSYRQWINGALAAVNANGQVLGLQNSTSPASPVANTVLYNILPGQGLYRGTTTYPPYPYSSNPNVPVPYYAYNDPASVPYPVIWVPQTSGGAVTGYTPVTLTMPQAGMSFKGNAGMFLNKNLQIAGGFKGDPNAFTGEDAPFLWQNYQYHNLSDFFPALSGYAKFQVRGLDDNGTVTALATPSSPANASQQILQLCPFQLTDIQNPASPVMINAAVQGGADPTKGGNGIAYIVADDGTSYHAPKMPQLIAQITGIPGSNLQVNWKLDANFTPSPAGNPGNTHFPNSNGNPTTRMLPITSPWNIYQEWASSTFFGGNCTLSFQILQADGKTIVQDWQSFTFQILGNNPDPATCKAQIIANEGSLWYAWAVAKHESGDSSSHPYYNQFANGTASGGAGAHGAKGNPFYSPSEGDGWGLFQLDTSSGLPVITNYCWSWQANMQGWISGEYPGDLQIANNYVNGIQAANSSTFQEPVFVIQGVSISGRDAAALTYYNSGLLPSHYLHFDGTQPSGHRWTFTPPNAPNKLDSYINEVISVYNGG